MELFFHLSFCFQSDAFTDEPASTTTTTTTTVQPNQPDPAEMWKKDFQCQWFETSEEAISDQESPKDGVGRTEDVEGPGGASTVKDSSLGEPEDSSTSVTGSPKPSLEVPTDHGTKPGHQITTLLLLLVAKELPRVL